MPKRGLAQVLPFVSLLKPKYVMQQRACPHPYTR